MEEHELRESLRRLPDARPGAEFTAEVLARVERFERRRSLNLADDAGARGAAPGGGARWRPTLLAAGLAAALVAAVGLWPPLGANRWSEGGGGETSGSAEARSKRPAEGVGGGRVGGGEGAASESLRTAGHGEEVAEDRPAGDGDDVGSVVPRAGRLADGARGAGLTGGASTARAPQRPALESPGAPDPRGTRGGSPSPQGGSSQPSPLGDRGSAATDAEGSIGEDRLASAPVVAGGGDAIPGADGGEDAAPPATARRADTLAALPGADFFAAPPTGGLPNGGVPAGAPRSSAAVDPATLPAAQRLARLRAEREALERRLVAFRRELPPAEPPVVLLGGDEGLELVFDLGRWAAPPPTGEAAGAARPAVHSTQGPPRRF